MNGGVCTLCPRMCGVDRDRQKGFCGMGNQPVLARAGLHQWEEPCVSGTRGSGTVFFSGCSLKCVYCQNFPISWGGKGKEITPGRLRDIFQELADKGAHNINLVNPTHFAHVLEKALESPPPIPVVYNSSGYERVETLKRLEGKIQIYLPDIKYSDDRLGLRYSNAPHYFETAQAAAEEMARQTGPYQLDDDGILQSGTMIRHLILPGMLPNTFGVLDYIARTFSPGQVMLSLMSQYTPCGKAEEYPELRRRVTARELERVETYLFYTGIEDGYLQDRDSAKTAYIPDFNMDGI